MVTLKFKVIVPWWVRVYWRLFLWFYVSGFLPGYPEQAARACVDFVIKHTKIEPVR